jgi:branched-chain amino acid transport system substrate-binding protein
MRRVGTLFLLFWAATTASAQIYVGQTSGFSGPVASGVKENTDGAKLYLEHVNRNGGVHGQSVLLVSVDDKFEPKLAAQNARQLITERNVVALFMNRGTPHTEAIRPLLEEFKVPLVAPSTGAMILHKPVHPWIFNVRATYQREAEKAVSHLASTGVTRIGVIQVDDSFGVDVATGAAKGFAGAKLQPVFHEKFDRTTPDFAKALDRVVATEPQAILFIGSAGAVTDGMKALRARGSIVSQVFPYERSLSAPMVKEAHDLAVAKGLEGVTPAMLEGYAGAKVLVEGLKRSGPSPTRQRLRDALESMRKVDIGGLEVNYSPASHTGLDYADLSIIGADGKFRR